METKRHDGDNVLINKASFSEIEKALKDKDTKSVSIHKPGEIITHSDGQRYQVRDNGSWKKLTPEECQEIQNIKLPSEKHRGTQND